MSRPRKIQVARVRKLWGKGLASLPLLDGKRRREQDKVDFIAAGRNTQFDLHDDEVASLARALADDGLARRIRTIQRERYPYGTVPELIFLEFLERKGEEYTYQAQVLGGYRGGGLVPDFVVKRGGEQVAILIQGIYWHNIPGKKEKDIADKLRLLGANYEGRQITKVVFVWENKIVAPDPGRSTALESAIVGIETGQ